MPSERSLQELLDSNDSAWPIVQAWVRAAENSVVLLEPDERQRADALIQTNVTTHSPIGAIVYHTGGLLVDKGWLRVLGSGHSKLPRSLPSWNRGRSTTAEGKPLGFWLIADDVAGGFYALNGGAFGRPDGRVFYFAPDTLRWEPMNGMGYSEFLAWCLSSNLAHFYESVRWEGWEVEIAQLEGDQGLSIYPFLWAEEGRDIAKCSRRPAPISEIFALNLVEFPKQLGTRLR